jgi:hypothetical protein
MTETRMDLGGYTTWQCMGCPSNGRHHKAPPAQVHADLTGHKVQVTISTIYLVYPAGDPPIPVETKQTGLGPASIPFEVNPDDLTSDYQPVTSSSNPHGQRLEVHVGPPPGVPLGGGGPPPSPLAMTTRRMRTTQ